MIYLTPLVAPELEGETVTRQEYDAAEDFLRDAWLDLPKEFTLTVQSAKDEDGRVYSDLKFRVESRFRQGDDHFVAGGGYAISIDEVLTLAREMVE